MLRQRREALRVSPALVRTPRALLQNKKDAPSTEVTLRRPLPRGRSFARGEDPRRQGYKDGQTPSQTPPATELVAAEVLSGAFGTERPRRELTAAETGLRVEGRELVALQKRRDQLEAEGYTGRDLYEELGRTSLLSPSGARGALERGAAEAYLTAEELKAKRLSQRGGRPRSLPDELYYAACAEARKWKRGAYKVMLAFCRNAGWKGHRTTLRKLMRERGWKRRPGVDYDPLTPQVRSRRPFDTPTSDTRRAVAADGDPPLPYRSHTQVPGGARQPRIHGQAQEALLPGRVRFRAGLQAFSVLL